MLSLFLQRSFVIVCSNLFKFTLSTIIIYKVGNTRCHFRWHALIQHNFFHEIWTPTENKHGLFSVLPHTNTVILLEPCCGTITEPGLPVLKLACEKTRRWWGEKWKWGSGEWGLFSLEPIFPFFPTKGEGA